MVREEGPVLSAAAFEPCPTPLRREIRFPCKCQSCRALNQAADVCSPGASITLYTRINLTCIFHSLVTYYPAIKAGQWNSELAVIQTLLLLLIMYGQVIYKCDDIKWSQLIKLFVVASRSDY